MPNGLRTMNKKSIKFWAAIFLSFVLGALGGALGSKFAILYCYFLFYYWMIIGVIIGVILAWTWYFLPLKKFLIIMILSFICSFMGMILAALTSPIIRSFYYHLGIRLSGLFRFRLILAYFTFGFFIPWLCYLLQKKFKRILKQIKA